MATPKIEIETTVADLRTGDIVKDRAKWVTVEKFSEPCDRHHRHINNTGCWDNAALVLVRR